jgi:hypothetical protein
MPNDGVRGYIRTLREARLAADSQRPSVFSQKRFGPAIGYSERAYIDWEMGSTKTIKDGLLLKALALLDAPWEDVAQLAGADFEAGVQLAEHRLQQAVPVPSSGEPSLGADPDRVFDRVFDEYFSKGLSEGDQKLAESLFDVLRQLARRARRA